MSIILEIKFEKFDNFEKINNITKISLEIVNKIYIVILKNYKKNTDNEKIKEREVKLFYSDIKFIRIMISMIRYDYIESDEYNITFKLIKDNILIFKVQVDVNYDAFFENFTDCISIIQNELRFNKSLKDSAFDKLSVSDQFENLERKN